MSKPHILLLSDWFPPAYKAGGPIRSCVNFTYAMRKRYRISVLTSDRDLGSKTPLEKIEVNQWQAFSEGVEVCYLSPEWQNRRKLQELIQERQADFLYLNSMFSLPFTILPLRLKQKGKIEAKVILAPRGMLKEETLASKAYKKTPFLMILRWVKIHQWVRFQATNQQEVEDIQRTIHPKADIVKVGNWPEARQESWNRLQKEKGTARWVLIARIAWVKNLEYLFERLKNFPLPFELDIFGPMEDPAYWEKCQAILKQCPPHIKVTWQGQLPNEEIRERLSQYHFFVLPTHGENFGHAIFESLQMGKPVLISHNTPWQQLEAQAVGWDIHFDQKDKWLKALTQAVEMDQETYDRWSQNAWQYAANYLQNAELAEKYEQLFSSKS
ncbi:MAG: glycosyltransferase family 4 protein [Bacteroidota bacterium]